MRCLTSSPRYLPSGVLETERSVHREVLYSETHCKDTGVGPGSCPRASALLATCAGKLLSGVPRGEIVYPEGAHSGTQ